MFNTIILKKGFASLTKSEAKKFRKGDLICGENRDPEELDRWPIEEEQQAKEALARYKCSYCDSHTCLTNIEEYALEYCECDEDGEFIQGSDYEFAEEI